MNDIAELQQRVREAGERFGQLADQDRTYSERLTSLLLQVEVAFTRSREEIDELNRELGQLKDENQQLKAMLQNLLAALESGGVQGFGTAMGELETRIGRLTTSISAIAASPGQGPGGPTTTEPAPREATSGGAPAMPEIAVSEAVELTAQDSAGKADEPASPAPQTDQAPGETPAAAEPAADDAASLPPRATAEAPSDAELNTVNKIIQRVSLLTGEFVDPSHRRAKKAEAEDTKQDQSDGKDRLAGTG